MIQNLIDAAPIIIDATWKVGRIALLVAFIASLAVCVSEGGSNE